MVDSRVVAFVNFDGGFDDKFTMCGCSIGTVARSWGIACVDSVLHRVAIAARWVTDKPRPN